MKAGSCFARSPTVAWLPKRSVLSCPWSKWSQLWIPLVKFWGFKAWFTGLHPTTDAFGDTLSGERLAKAGSKICKNGTRCIVWALPADCEHNSIEHQLPNYNSNNPWCKCNRSDTPWNDFNATALWRAKRYTKEEVHETPMSPHWAFTIPGVNHGTFAHDFCALCRFGFLLGSCCKPGKRSDRIAQLLDLVNQCYDDLEISVGRISRLALSHFTPDVGAPHKHYPTLTHSAIKAKQTAYLVPVCLKLAEQFNDGSQYRLRRQKCLKHLLQKKKERTTRWQQRSFCNTMQKCIFCSTLQRVEGIWTQDVFGPTQENT